MAGVWEALFQEEKQDFVSAIAGGVTALFNFAAEVPCILLAFLTTALTLGCDYASQGAQQACDLLGLEEWWTMEHTLIMAGLLWGIPFYYKRANGDWHHFWLQQMFGAGHLAHFGCMLYMILGFQGGIVFGGKFFFPTLAFLAVLHQGLRNMLTMIRKEIAGYAHDAKLADEKTKHMFELWEKAFCHISTALLFFATFGFPKFDLEADPTPWLAVFPVIAYHRLCVAHYDDICAKAAALNGTPPQVEAAKEKKAEEPAAKKAEEPAAKEEKKDEEKKDDAKAEPAKGNPINQAIDAVCGLVSSVFCLVTSAAGKVVSCVKCVRDKVTSLPWETIFQVSSTIGVSVGMTLAYWNLTEDRIIFVAPVLTFLGPFLLGKLEDKGWLEAKGVHMGCELMHFVGSMLQFYIFRTYISLPF